MKKKILIIGFGNIGFRHAQSLLKDNYLIYIVDPSSKYFRKILKEKSKKNIFYFSDLKMIKEKKFDLLISATTADKRYKTTLSALNKFTIKNIIFEKVVFTKKIEFLKMQIILKKNHIKSWVNCPLRNMLVFKSIKKLVKKREDLSIIIKGSKWNMASNAIHYLDLYNFLDSSTFINFRNNLSKKIYYSKRKGFFELYGKIEFLINKKKFLVLENFKKSVPFKINIVFNNHLFNLTLGKTENKLNHYFKKKLMKKTNFFIDQQSKMTSKVVRRIFKKKNPGLISFEKSMILHMVFIKFLNQHLKQNLKNVKNYSIT